MRIQIKKFTLKILMLFPIFTLLAFIPSGTTILSAVGMVCMLYSILQSRAKLTHVICMVSVILLSIWGFSVTSEAVINPNEAIYFGYLSVFATFWVSNKRALMEYFYREKRYIKGICIIWCVLVVFSMLLPSSYDSGVFVSFAIDTFRLSPSAILIMALSGMLIATEKKQGDIVYSLIPLLAILLGSSRTYLVVGALLFCINLSMVIKRKDIFISMAVVLAIFGGIIVMNSSMGAKFLSSMMEHEYIDEAAVFTSGRSNFWTEDLEAFEKQSLKKQVLGCGLNFIRITNGAVPGTDIKGIWAHNDFIQIVITYGYVGLVLYLVSMRMIFTKFSRLRLPFTVNLAIFMIWFFNAMFNMYFTYACSMIALPVVIMACEVYRLNHKTWFVGKEEVFKR